MVLGECGNQLSKGYFVWLLFLRMVGKKGGNEGGQPKNPEK
jgi:hypothetical protein